MPTTLKFFVRENDQEFPVCFMSSKEADAIGECVDDLIPNEYQMSDVFWLEADLVFSGEDDNDDDPAYGRLRCYTYNPNPSNGSLAESRIPFEMPEELVQMLAGKTFRVNPRQLGVNAWGERVEIRFEM